MLEPPQVTPQGRAVQRTAAAYFCQFLVGGLIAPFLSPTMLSLGYSHAETGLILASASMAATVVPLLVGRFADSRLTLHRTLRLGCALVFSVVLLLQEHAQRSVTFVALLFLLYAARAPLSSLLDTFGMQVAHNAAALYGRMRLCGSLGFMVAATSAGSLLGHGRMHWFFPCLLAASAVSCLAGWILPPQAKPAHMVASTRGFWRSLDRPFCLWLLAMMLHWFAFAPYQYGFSLFLHEQRVPESFTGALWSVGVLAEVLAFSASPWVFRRFTAHQVSLCALAASFVRWLVLGLWPNIFVIVASQVLHGPSFALYYAAAMQTIGTFNHGRFRSSYQGLYATAVGGVAASLGTATAGWLHGSMPFYAVLLFMLPVQAAAFLLLWSQPRAGLSFALRRA